MVNDPNQSSSVQNVLNYQDPHSRALDLVNILQLLGQRTKDATPDASLLKYMVPEGQQYHPGFEPGGLIDALANELGINPSAFDGLRQSTPIPLSKFLSAQTPLEDDLKTANALLDMIYNPSSTAASGGTAGANAPATGEQLAQNASNAAAGVGLLNFQGATKSGGLAPVGASFGSPTAQLTLPTSSTQKSPKAGKAASKLLKFRPVLAP